MGFGVDQLHGADHTVHLKHQALAGGQGSRAAVRDDPGLGARITPDADAPLAVVARRMRQRGENDTQKCRSSKSPRRCLDSDNK